MRAALFGLALLLAGPAWAAECPLDLGHGTGTVVFSDKVMLALRPDPLHIEVGQPFALLLNVCTKEGEPAELVGVEVSLDESTHGAKPSVEPHENGRYRVDGVTLIKPGSWEVAFDVRTGGEIQRLTHDFILK